MGEYTYDDLMRAAETARSRGNETAARKLMAAAEQRKPTPVLAATKKAEGSWALDDAWSMAKSRAGAIAEGAVRTADVIDNRLLGDSFDPKAVIKGLEDFQASNAIPEGTFSGATWEGVKANPTLPNIGRFIAETGIASAPDTLAAMASFIPGIGPIIGAGLIGGYTGEALEQRLDNDGRRGQEPTLKDIGYSAASGAATALLERTGAGRILKPGGKTVASRLTRAGANEASTEAAEGFAQDYLTTVDTKTGFDPMRALDLAAAGAVGGGGVGAAYRTPAELVNAVVRPRDPEEEPLEVPDEDHVRAAQDLLEASDYNLDMLGDTRTTDGDSAQGVAKGALKTLRRVAQERSKELTRLVKKQDMGQEARDAVRSLMGTLENHKARTSQESINRIGELFPDNADAAELQSLARRISIIQDFAGSKGDMGGLTRWTRLIDPTDERNEFRAITTLGSLATLGSSGLAGIGINRAARVVDNMTGYRSRVRRYVEQNADRTAPPFSGTRSEAIIKQLKESEKTKVAADRLARELEKRLQRRQKQIAKGDRRGPWDAPGLVSESQGRSVKVPGKTLDETQRLLEDTKKRREAEAKLSEQTKADAAAAKASEDAKKLAEKAAVRQRAAHVVDLGRQAMRRMFETGEYPPGVIGAPYKLWSAAIGLSPAEILQGMRQLQETGALEPWIGDAFESGDMRLFETRMQDGKTKIYVPIQQFLRNNLNPDYEPPADAFDLDPDDSEDGDGDSEGPTIRASAKAKAKLNGGVTRAPALRGNDLGKNNTDAKSREGRRRANALLDQIELDPNLSESERSELVTVVDYINRADMARTDRADHAYPAIDGIFSRKLADKAKRELWKARFKPLVSIGNDAPIYKDMPTEERVEFEFSERVKGKPTPPKKPPVAAEEAPATPRPSVLSRLGKPPALDPVGPSPDETDFRFPEEQTVDDSIEVPDADVALGRASEHLLTLANDAEPTEKGLFVRMGRALAKWYVAAEELALGPEGEVERRKADLDQQGTPKALVERLILDNPGSVTQNGLTERYARERGIKLSQAIEPVHNALADLAAEGKVQRFVKPGSLGMLTYKDNPVKTTDKQPVVVIDVKPVRGSELERLLRKAQAAQMLEKLPDISQPGPAYTVDVARHGDFEAVRNVDQLGLQHTPAITFLNMLRSSPLGINSNIMKAIADRLQGDPSRLGEFAKMLEDRTEKGKDDGNMRAFVQLLFQSEAAGTRHIYQEWFFDHRFRVYPANGSATTQGADLMKGLTRAPERYAVGGRAGLDFMFHSFGNILGFDKEAPSVRRSAIFEGDTINELLKFAEEPFRRNVFGRSPKNPNALGKIVKGSEGPFQTLNVAFELRDMVQFARARFPDEPADAKELLSDPAVQADIAQNYKTDFIVQLDANNNNFQLIGLMTGDAAMLQATGMARRPNTNPDVDAPADVYVAPAQAVAARVPELNGWPAKQLRKLFKRAISNYAYNASDGSRQKSFDTELRKIAEDMGVPAFGRDGSPGLINMPQAFVDGLKDGSVIEFEEASYAQDGSTKPLRKVRWKLEAEGEGDKAGFRLMRATGNRAKFGPSRKFETKDAAVEWLYSQSMYGRMNRELIRDINMRFPQVAAYMSFARSIEDWMKAEGVQTITLTAPDGVTVDYSLSSLPIYGANDVSLGEGRKPVRMGLPTDQKYLSGQGLAANIAHMLDAYVLRETYRLLNEQKPLATFNPIHDSFGFHPADTKRGRDMVLAVMQTLGEQKFNIFEAIVQSNNLPRDKVLMPQRIGINPQGPDDIPTAVS